MPTTGGPSRRDSGALHDDSPDGPHTLGPMKAVIIRRFGGPEVLQLAELPDPLAGPNEVRIRVHAAGTNPVDAGNRSDGTWAGLELPHIPGYDVAGIVDQV